MSCDFSAVLILLKLENELEYIIDFVDWWGCCSVRVWFLCPLFFVCAFSWSHVLWCTISFGVFLYNIFALFAYQKLAFFFCNVIPLFVYQEE